MSTHEEAFASHAAHAAISQIDAALKKVMAGDLADDSLDNLNRIRQAVRFIADRLESADPILATAAQLDQIGKSLQASLGQINQFEANNNVAHLANASNQLDTAITVAASVPMVGQPVPVAKAEDVISFRDLANKTIESLTASVTHVKDDAAQTSAHLQELGASIESQEKQLAALGTEIKSRLASLEAAFEKSQLERQSEVESLIASATKDFKQKVDELSSSAASTIDALNEKQDDAARIVSLIGNIGVTGNFRGAATAERRSANTFRYIALACFLAMVGVVLYMGFIALHERLNIWFAVFRLGFGFAFLVPGIYAAKESSKHRRLENRNRRAELELASIDAYLDSLPDDKKAELKASLTEKYFGSHAEEPQVEGDVSGQSIIDLLKIAIKQLGKA